MSIVFSKNKEKRPRTSSNETNTSFVKNVTSRVSGLLPSTITKWFSSPSSSNTNGSAPTADATDSSTEDEASESPIVTQPPLKRMRYNTPNKFNHFGPTDSNCSTSNIEITEMPVHPFPGTQYPSSRNSLTLSPIWTSNETITNESSKEKNERDSSRFKSSQHTVSSIGQSIAIKRKSIFDKSTEDSANTSTKQSPTAEKKPCFKPGLLGSPFYPGRTMYGGAASSYINQPNIQQHTVALVNEVKSSEDSVMSSSARRIMDLLESYSSPLVEARRIPQYTRPKNDSLNTSADRFAPYANRSLSYKTQELHVPSIASILRLKQRSRLMDSTKTARQIIASHSSAATNYPLTYPTPTSNASETSQAIPPRQDINKEPSYKMTTKVKTRVTRTNRGNQEQLEMATPVKLPSATLQIDQNKMLKFSFDTPAVSKAPATSTPKIVFPAPKMAETKKNTEVSTSKPETVTSSSVFKFSNPVKICYDIPDTTTTPPKFTFESPERRVEQNCDSKSDVSSVVGDIDVPDKSTTKPKDWQCPDCWVNNKADVAKCVCCGYKAVKAVKCSVCKIADSQVQKDKCVICDKMASSPIPAKSSQSLKWKCDSCWIMNEDSVAKCVCCGENKPNEAGKAMKAAKAAELAAFPKAHVQSCGGGFRIGDERSWDIDPKQVKPLPLPTSMTTFFGSNDKSDSTFITLAKTQKSDKWECTSCLVRNESDKSVCVCCGAEKEPSSKLPDTKFNFGSSTNTSFKFGIDPKVQEAKINQKSDEKPTPEPKLKEQSETNNNVLAETPTFTFTLPTKKIETKTDSLKTDTKEAVMFSFGIPKAASVATNKLVSLPAKVVEEDKEKPQEVPQVNFATPPVQETMKSVALFASPLTQQVEKAKSPIPASNLFTPPAVEAKNDTLSNSNNVPTVVASIEKSQPQNTFTLGSCTLKPATNLFATPGAIGSSSNPFTSPAQTTAVTTSASNMSIILPAATVQKNETNSNTVLAPAAPIFSFGNTGANNLASMATPVTASVAAPADKPKFQFTFGSNNSITTDAVPSILTGQNTQSVFKSPFGSTADSTVKNTNTFSLNPGNTLGPHNSLATGTNGLSAPNGLPGNGLSANTLGANTMGSNTLSVNPLGGNGIAGNGLSGNLLGGNTLTGNTFATNSLTGGNGVTSTSTLGGTNGLPGSTHTGNALQTSNTLTSNALSSGTPNIFGNAVQKENMWNSNNNAQPSNLFVSNTTTNSLQKPPTFAFGASTPFNATSPPPPFGNNAQPAQNIFGMANQNNNAQPTLFSSPVQNQNPTPLFGAAQPASNPAPQMPMFGSPNIGATPTFGTPNATIPSFEAPSMTPAPAFNFGAPPQPAGIFGFGQQQPQQQPQQPGVYSFGGPPPGTPQVQFNMGTAPNIAGRRLRKAVRRTTPR